MDAVFDNVVRDMSGFGGNGMKSLVFLSAMAAFGMAATVAYSQGPQVDGYCATLGDKDHFASDGYKLTDAAAIVRQDRANYHAFNVRDPGDQGDESFASKEGRAKLEAMVKKAKLPADLRKTIVEGTPDICVVVYADSVEVNIPAKLPFLGTWDCEVATFTFTTDTFNNGTDDLPIQEIQEGSDGSYAIFLSDEYFISVSGFVGDQMGWLSSETGDSFQCTRVGAP